jgi:cupin 2 domain-containing protein
MHSANLFAGIGTSTAEEVFTPLVEGKRFRLERIVSTGQASPPDEWYDQPDDEWVIVLRGRAALRYADGSVQEMAPGDHVLIPAHVRHRVEWTSADEPTVWLGLHFEP